jgi:hypothetical protein
VTESEAMNQWLLSMDSDHSACKPQRHTVTHNVKQCGLAILSAAPASRERSLAITKLEEARFWAHQAIIVARQESLL